MSQPKNLHWDETEGERMDWDEWCRLQKHELRYGPAKVIRDFRAEIIPPLLVRRH